MEKERQKCWRMSMAGKVRSTPLRGRRMAKRSPLSVIPIWALIKPKNDCFMLTKRQFIRDTAFLAAGSLFLPRLGSAAPKVRVKNIGIQLYTVRSEMLADPVATLKKIAAIGFKELESARSDKGNYYGLKPKEIRNITEDLGMKLRSGHIHVDNDWKRSLEEATETGQEYIISAVLPSQGQTVDHYKQSAEAFNKLGEECKKAGLHFGYHNHDSEFEPVDGTVLYDVLLKYTDPSLVTMER